MAVLAFIIAGIVGYLIYVSFFDPEIYIAARGIKRRRAKTSKRKKAKIASKYGKRWWRNQYRMMKRKQKREER
jgi:hypothetical protein